MKIYKIKIGQWMWVIAFTTLASIISCKKQDNFLNVKSKQSDVTPSTLQDFQAVLDNTVIMNETNSLDGLIASDNIYFTDVNLNSIDAVSRNSYLWAKDIYQGANSADWSSPYQVIEYANIVLDGLNNLPASDVNSAAYNLVKGSALFYRSFAFYRLSQLYCKSYSSTANTDLGIPLRLTSDITIKSARATLQETYDQIITDLTTAAKLLPQTALFKTRPSSVAANALLAKVYLSMSDYVNAFNYADQALKAYNVLLDYNTLKAGTANPFPSFAKGNPEIIFYGQTYGLTATVVGSGGKARIDTNLIKTYATGDLRKADFYLADGTTGLYKFKGSYTDNSYEFSGIATDEIYLIHAECLARAGNISSALTDINTLLKYRYTAGTYQNLTTTNQSQLLSQILLERRKEMPFTGNIRWEDLKRLNMDANFAHTLSRYSNSALYTLAPNDNRYIFPIPDPEIQAEGLQQNQR